MNKYIDSEKLIAEIERRKIQHEIDYDNGDETEFHRIVEDNAILKYIASLQQEQPVVQNGKFVFPKYLYARTKNNKTIDMSYAPQDMTAVEYIRNDSIEQEQLEVDLDFRTFAQEMDSIYALPSSETKNTEEEPLNWEYAIARHFYELGKNARKEETK